MLQEGENVKAKPRSVSSIECSVFYFSSLSEVLRYNVIVKDRYNLLNGRNAYFKMKFARSLHSTRNVQFQLLDTLPRNAALVAIETVWSVRHVKFIYADCPHNWFSILVRCAVLCSIENLTLLRYDDRLHRNRAFHSLEDPCLRDDLKIAPILLFRKYTQQHNTMVRSRVIKSSWLFSLAVV